MIYVSDFNFDTYIKTTSDFDICINFSCFISIFLIHISFINNKCRFQPRFHSPKPKEGIMAKKKFDRKKLKMDASKRGKISYDKRDDKGRFRDFFNPAKMENISKWWAPKGEHLIDIIPYYAGANDPQIPEGRGTYLLDIFVHPKVGPGEDTFVCPVQYHERCPICEERKRRSDAGEDYETRIKPLNTSRRVAYNVVVRDNGKEEKKGIQIFEIAHWFMEKTLIKIAKNPRGGRDEFWDADTGKSIAFERTGTGAQNTQYDGHRLVDRDYIISDEELEAAHCLDDLIHRASYEEISKAFFGGDTPTSDIESEESMNPEDGEEEEVATEPEDSYEDDPEPDEPPPTPARKKKKAVKKKAVKKKKKALSCPYADSGLVFGKNFDEYEECDNCNISTQCEIESNTPF
jgi:hypothetical protein